MQTVCKNFGVDESRLTPEAKLALAPKDLRHARIILHSGEKAVLYTDIDGKPLWININDKYLVPTIYTLWKSPYLAKLVQTPGQVLEVLQGGADLMIPGCFPPYPDVQAGQIVAVSLLARPTVPIGVGIALTSLSNLDRSNKGKAVQMVHVIGDSLCDKFKSELKPPLEFDLTIPYIASEKVEGSAEGASSSEAKQDTEKPASQNGESVEPQITEAVENLTINTQDTPVVKKAEPSQEIDTDEFTTDEVDEAFRVGLLQALRKALDDPIEVPITASNFMGNYILDNLPIDSPNLNLKKSSWKKASKFFKAMEKEGLVKVKDRGDEVVIQSMSGREDDRVKNFVIFQTKKKVKPPTSVKSSQGTKLTSIDLWKPHSNALKFLREADPNTVAQYYDNLMLRTILVGYINKKKLTDNSNKKNIVADDLLASALNMPKESALNAQLRIISRDKILARLQSSCTPFHVIYDPEDPALTDETAAALLKTFKPAKGVVPTILIETERRGGNKVVTKVTNLEPFHIQPTALAEELRKSCAGSTSVNPVKEGSDSMEVLVQGPQIKAVQDALFKRGVRQQWVEVKEKGTKNGKKKR